MSESVDTNKAVRQHLEMDAFFTGFAIKGRSEMAAEGPPANAPDVAAQVTPAPVAPAQGRDDLEAVAAEARACRKCGLSAERTNAVPGEGHPKARIMFVGEAPGADEDAQGRPFVGRAGQLLDKIIVACGLKREDVFIGNILKCRPPGNRDPKPDEIIKCLPYLQRQIEAIEPEIIIALGAHAARTLLNTNQSIGQMRGRFHEYVAGIGRPPVKLMATYHPAYLLRNYTPDTRRRVWDDMRKVLAELGLPIPERG